MIPEVILFESVTGTPFSSSAGVMLNTCNIDETMEKSVLSLKNRPGQILTSSISSQCRLLCKKSACISPTTKAKRTDIWLTHSGVQLAVFQIMLGTKFRGVFEDFLVVENRPIYRVVCAATLECVYMLNSTNLFHTKNFQRPWFLLE